MEKHTSWYNHCFYQQNYDDGELLHEPLVIPDKHSKITYKVKYKYFPAQIPNTTITFDNDCIPTTNMLTSYVTKDRSWMLWCYLSNDLVQGNSKLLKCV